MIKFLHIFILLIVSTFAFGNVLHSANATTMSMKIMTAAVDGAEMDQCQECANSDKLSSCDSACVSPVLAVLQSPSPEIRVFAAITKTMFSINITGLVGLPEPHPPKSIILN
ncbi:MAG: hypothetical protein WBC85_13600 [Planktotalea sp.]|uniref:hypothetical protein n=1 Tax=Planktotalea sp. TaxID=2029877 RepID=UPI003C726DA2